MSFPRIYSLSTIGILKHYIHDYIFHPKRTDFIGPNGVGKSIIADLLQLMFVFDKSLIKFGTDSVKKEERNIHTLPYRSSIAYSFLNIEIDADRFITIGIQISSQSNQRIIPFIITSEADLGLSLENLAIEKSKALFAKHLIKENKIIDFQELAEYIHTKYALKLNFFKTNDEILDYYNFLYSKYIIPIDLSKGRNLKAFAKVIQSFSKVKALHLSGHQASTSLKEFLFEESDEDIVFNFNKEKGELENILRDYQSLNHTIETLGKKQILLTELKALDEQCEIHLKEYKKAEIENMQFLLAELTTQKHDKGKVLDNALSREAKAQRNSTRGPNIEKLITSNFEKANGNFANFDKFKSKYESLKSAETQIGKLENRELLMINDEWLENVIKIDISIRDVDAILSEIDFAEPLLKKYKTLKELLKIRKSQGDSIETLKSNLKSSKSNKSKIILLLQNEEENSLLSWYLLNVQNQSFNEDQVQAILHLAEIPITNVENPKDNDKYLNPESFFEKFKVIKTDTGMWLELGAFYEFVSNKPEAELLHNTGALDSSIGKYIEKLTGEINFIDKQLEALDNITDGKLYDTSLFDNNFDINIVEHSNIERLKGAVALMLQVGEKIQILKEEKEDLIKEISTLKSDFGIEFSDVAEIKKRLVNIKDIWFNRVTRITRILSENESFLKQVKSEIKGVSDEMIDIADKISKNEIIVEELRELYRITYDEDINDSLVEKKDIDSLEQMHRDVLEKYKEKYYATVAKFDETTDAKNHAVQFTINEKTFSFRILEEALLGTKIKSTDDITNALQEANNTRTNIADGIRDNMIKIFSKTTERYEKYKEQVQRINAFFINRKISGQFYFKLDFIENTELNISYVKEMAFKVRQSAKQGELQFGQSIVDFVEEYFSKQARIKNKVPINKLLDPKTYFELSAKLTDEDGTEVSGSTGETYSAISLLGVARLSAVQKENRKGLRFIILEELGSLDNTNFNTFPAIAEEFKFQIITMGPRVLNIGIADQWFAHHLIKGKANSRINYYPSASYFKSKNHSELLDAYLNTHNELD